MGKFKGSGYVNPLAPLLSMRMRPAAAAVKAQASAPESASAAEPTAKVERAARKLRKATPVTAAAIQQASLQQASGRFVPGEQQRQARGGTARSQRLAPAQRQDIARRAASARWGRKTVGNTQEAR